MLLRGIWYRAGRSATVLLLAAVAIAAAVLGPGYSRAAQQSVLTDGLAAAPPAATGLTATASGTAEQSPAGHPDPAAVRRAADLALAGSPALAGVFAAPVAAVDTDSTLAGGAEPVAARLVWRERVCQQLAITGGCPAGAGELLVSERTAAEYRIAVGDRLSATFTGEPAEFVVVGTYRPLAPADPYWGRSVYFAHGGFDPATGAPRVDAVFTGAPADVTGDPAAVVNAAVTYPLHPAAVPLDGVPALRAELAGLPGALQRAGLELDTELPAVLDDVAAETTTIARTTPVLAAPLLVLGWFVLFLVVSAVTGERGREVGLARLRGYAGGRAVRFGLAEVLVLIAAAAPVGFGLGLLGVGFAARLALTAGTPVELRWPLYVSAVGALLAAALAALLAARITLRRDALELLRRVARRRRWRAGVVEGLVVALAVAGLVVALGDPLAPLALLAPALVAVLAGIVAARLAVGSAGWRLRRAGRRAGRRGVRRLPGLLAAAQLARRPTGRAVIAVSTVAVALLSFATIAWDAAASARLDRATDTVGADRVYTVRADHPAALVEAVRATSAGSAMAVVRAREQYAGEQVEVLAVDTAALPEVVTWRGHSQVELRRLAQALRPAEPAPLFLGAELAVQAEVAGLGEEPVRLTALVSAPGQPPRAVPLGVLAAGERGYAADLPDCPAGCRLLGFGLGGTGAGRPFTATVTIASIRSGGADLPARFDDPSAWQGPAGVGLAAGSALTVTVEAGHTGDVQVAYRDTPAAVPVVLAGAAPTDDPAAAEFEFLGLAERPEPFTTTARVARLPRAGERGLLLDLGYAVASAERSIALADHSGLSYEVWAAPGAPADLPQRLSGHGVAVLATESIDGTAARLGSRAPALGLWLGLLAAAVAVALAVGVVALSATAQRPARLADAAALRVAGVPAGVLRRALWREHGALLGWPVLAGAVAGIAMAAVLLPSLPLVESGVTSGLPGPQLVLGALAGGGPGFAAVPAAAAAVGAGWLLAAFLAVRMSASGGGQAGER